MAVLCLRLVGHAIADPHSLPEVRQPSHLARLTRLLGQQPGLWAPASPGLLAPVTGQT